MPGKIYLIPTFLDPDNLEVIPEQTKRIALRLKYIIAENIRTTRRYLKALDRTVDIDSIHFFECNKKTEKGEIAQIIKAAADGHEMGVFSEAGCPGIADPGQLVASVAHKKGIQVVPLSGPSSIFLALMASGMNGQGFQFHGYLPIDEMKKQKVLRHFEKEGHNRNQTQIFMETPYRNNKLLATLMRTLSDNTRLCIASNITGNNESIQTKTIKEWKSQLPDIHKQPTIFLIL